MIRILVSSILTLCVLLATQLYAESSFDHSHQAFSRLLNEYVLEHGKKSSVRYKALKSSPQELSRYLKSLSAVTRERFNSFSRDEQLAFLINAYNGFGAKQLIGGRRFAQRRGKVLQHAPTNFVHY